MAARCIVVSLLFVGFALFSIVLFEIGRLKELLQAVSSYKAPCCYALER